MAESLRQKSSTPTTPAATTAPAQTPAAPQRTGNAAAQERLGLTGAVPTAAGTTDAALAAMGDMGAVVLDALPLGPALRLAMGQRGASWAEAWMCAQPVTDILQHVPDLVVRGFDAVCPVGFGMEVDEAVSVGHLALSAAESAAVGFSRTPEGFALSVKAGLQGGLSVGLGAKLSGAMGDTALGGDVGGSLSQATGYEAAWDFDIAKVLRLLAGRAPVTLLDVLLERPADVPAAIARALLELADTQLPSSWSVDMRAVGEASAAAGTGGFASADAGARGDAGMKAGHEDGESFLEVSTGVSGGAGWDNKLLEVLRYFGLPELRLGSGTNFRVRVSGSGVDLAAMAVENLRFTIASTNTIGDTSVEDAFETPSVVAAVNWMAAAMNPIDTFVGEDGPSVAAHDLPDVALRRSATRSVADVTEITDPNVVAELYEFLTPDKRGFVTYSASAELTGEVYVPVDAVRAALDGEPLSPGGEGIEARVLDVERMIAAEAVGGSSLLAAGLPPVDLAAGAELVELPKVEAVVKHRSRAGLGGAVSVGVVEEINANAGITITENVTLSPDIASEQRRALFAS